MTQDTTEHCAYKHYIQNNKSWLCGKYKYIFAFLFFIPQQCDGSGSWSPSFWRVEAIHAVYSKSWLLMTWRHKEPGPWFNIKMSSYQYRKSHCGDKTILRPSYLHNGISYTGKMTSLYWIRAQGISSQGIDLVIKKIFQFQQQKGQHIPALPTWPTMADNILRVSCQKGPICHALAWQIGPFWQHTIDLQMCFLARIYWYFYLNFTYFFP